ESTPPTNRSLTERRRIGLLTWLRHVTVRSSCCRKNGSTFENAASILWPPHASPVVATVAPSGRRYRSSGRRTWVGRRDFLSRSTLTYQVFGSSRIGVISITN